MDDIIDISYTDYAKMVGRSNVCLYYNGNKTTIEQLFILVKSQQDTEGFQIDIHNNVFNAEEVEIGLEGCNIALTLDAELREYGDVLEEHGMKEIIKMCNEWNKKHSKTFIVQGKYRIDITEEIDRLIEESKDYEYSV